MAANMIPTVEAFLKSVVPVEEIRAQARSLGVVQRRRTVDAAYAFDDPRQVRA